jgi:hypothetical protein
MLNILFQAHDVSFVHGGTLLNQFEWLIDTDITVLLASDKYFGGVVSFVLLIVDLLALAFSSPAVRCDEFAAYLLMCILIVIQIFWIRKFSLLQ